MTAANFRPRSLTVCPVDDARLRDERDRGLLGGSLVFALLVHLIVLVVPLPRRPAAPPQPPPRSPVIKISIPELRPPKPQRNRVRDTRPVEYLAAIPFSEQLEHEPVIDHDPPPEEQDVEFVMQDLPLNPVPPPSPPIFDEGAEGLIAPVPLPDRAQPGYPEAARQARIQGRVALTAVIGQDGKVVSVSVLHVSRPDLGFSEAAIEAVSQWRYEPGRYRGRPVAVRLRVVVEFSLR